MLVYIMIAVALLIGTGCHNTNALCTNDFEQGISSLKGWTKSGSAFNNQPTYGDNPSIRKPGVKANHQGNYWIGTYENRPKPDSLPGKVQTDLPTGTLTSPAFKITGSDINFLIGGGCDQSRIRAELLINGSVVEYDTGDCSETMRRVHWFVGKYKGQTAKVRLVDSSSEGWGHLNFDDLKGDIKCQDTASPTAALPGRKTTVMETSEIPTMMEGSNATPMSQTGSPTPSSAGSKTTLRTSGIPTMMEGSNVTPMSQIGSPSPSSAGSKTIVGKTSGSPTTMEGRNAPMLLAGSPTKPRRTTLSVTSESSELEKGTNPTSMLPTRSKTTASTGSKTLLSVTSERPKLKKGTNPKSMSPTRSQTRASTGSRTTLSVTSEIPTLKEGTNPKSMSPTGSQRAASTGSKTTLSVTSRIPILKEGTNPKSKSPTGSQTTASTGSRTTLSVTSGIPTLKEGTNSKSMSPTGSQTKASTGSKTTLSVTSGIPTLKEGTNPKSKSPTGSQTTSSTGSRTTLSVTSGIPTLKEGTNPKSMSPTGSQTKASTGSKTTLRVTSGIPTLKEGTNLKSMSPTGSQTKASTGSKTTLSVTSEIPTLKEETNPTSMSPIGSQTKASTGSKTTLSVTSGIPTLKEGTNPKSMSPTGSQTTSSTGSRTTLSVTSGIPTLKEGTSPKSMSPTGSQTTASTGSKTTLSVTSERPKLKKGTNPTFMLPTGSQTTASTGSRATLSVTSEIPTLKEGTNPKSMSPTGSQRAASTGSKTTLSVTSGIPTLKEGTNLKSMSPTGSQTKASTGSKTTLSVTSGISTLKEGSNPKSMPPTGSQNKPSSSRNDTVSYKTSSNFSPSKRMTTTQMNIKIKSLENLLHQASPNTKQTKQDDTDHSDDECQIKFTKVGCFADKQSPPRPLNDLLFTEKNQNDLQKGGRNMKRKLCRCAEEAKRREFKVFGLQFYDECWSGKEAEKTYNVHKSSSNCFNNELKPCKDSDSECVGGPDANYVYRISNENRIMDSGPLNKSTHNITYNNNSKVVDRLTRPDKKPKLHDSTLNSPLNKPVKDFKNLVCKEFLVALLLPVRWRDDLKNPITMYYKNARQDVEFKLLNLYGEDEDFRGIEFEKFGRTENRSISKLYVVIKFDNTDNYLTKLIDYFGAQNVTAAGCYTPTRTQCPGFCPSICLPSCQPSCCIATYQPQAPLGTPMGTPIGTPVDYTSNQAYSYQQGYQSQPVIFHNTPPAVINTPDYQNMNPPQGNLQQLPVTSQNNFPTAFDPPCPESCQTICSTMCPQNCCKSVVQKSDKRHLRKILYGHSKP